VAENLPVTVRASETMEGRARLYARGDARLHAIDALRIGAITRLAARLGLPGTAGLDEVVPAVAAITSLSSAQVGSILVGAVPGNDAELVTLSDQLRDLERRATRATTPQPHGRMDP
jgi:precorrin-3B methylase